jgi:AAA domain
MNKFSNLVTTGAVARAQRIIIYGPHGIGKTTLASQFPASLVLDTEEGSLHLALSRILTTDYGSLCQVLDELTLLPYQSVIIDTIDRVELFLRSEVCREHRIAGMESMAYGKAWMFLAEKFSEFTTRYLDPLIGAGIHVVIIAHSNIKRVQYPGLDGFDRWELRLHPGCANRLKEWSDSILFLNYKTRVSDNNEGKPKGMGGKQRVIYTAHDATYDAKVRIDLAEELPCTFEAIEPLLCGWKRPPVNSLQQQFANALADLDPKHVIAFLIDRKQIQDDQQITDISPDYAREALRRLPDFRKAISEFDFISM